MKSWILPALLSWTFVMGPALSAHEGHDSAFGSKDAISAVSKRIKIDPEGIKAIGLETQSVKLTDLKKSLKANGEVKVADNRVYDVFPSSSGVVESVFAKEGDSVKKGQLLATVKSVEIAATVAKLLQDRQKSVSDLRRTQSQYKNDIALSEKTVEHSELDLKREESLLKEGITARKTYVDAKHEFDTQSVKLTALRNRLKEEIALQDKQVKTTTESIRSQLKIMGLSNQAVSQALTSGTVSASISIFAPVDGTVSEKDISIGATVNKDRKIFSIMNLSPIWVQLQIFQHDIHLIRLHQPVNVTSASGAKVEGRVELIGTELSQDSKTLPVRVVSQNRNGQLRPGMFATAELITGKSSNHMIVPATSVIEKDGQATVYVRSGQYFEAVPVKVAVASGDHTREVLDGLFEGDQVVVRGAKQLLAQSLLTGNSEKEVAHSDKKTEGNQKSAPALWLVIVIACTGALFTGAIGVFIGMRMSRRRTADTQDKKTELDKIC